MISQLMGMACALLCITQLNACLLQLLDVQKDSQVLTESNEFCAQALTRQAMSEFQKGHLELFDSTVGNNQCHINALYVVELFNAYKQGKIDLSEKSIKTFLTLSLFLSSSIAQSGKAAILVDRMFACRHELHPSLTKQHRDILNKFLKKSLIRHYAREKLSELTATYIRRLIEEFMTSEPARAQELKEIDKQTAESGIFPKHPGIELFLHAQTIRDIPIIFKIKIITAEGYELVTLQCSREGALTAAQPVSQDKPVIVVEGISSQCASMHSWHYYFIGRARCTKQLFYDGRNDPAHKCMLCTPLEKGLHQALPLTSYNGIVAQKAIAAAFFHSAQCEILAQFPLARKRFTDDLAYASEHGLCADRMTTFFIEHMYASMHNRAISTKRLCDSSTEEIFGQCKMKVT